jgi:hypothetical protein
MILIKFLIFLKVGGAKPGQAPPTMQVSLASIKAPMLAMHSTNVHEF